MSDKEDLTQKIVAGSLIVVVTNEAKSLEINLKIISGNVSLKIQRTFLVDKSLSMLRYS